MSCLSPLIHYIIIVLLIPVTLKYKLGAFYLALENRSYISDVKQNVVNKSETIVDLYCSTLPDQSRKRLCIFNFI